jgi:16S rRNA (cytosine967-C5)-methyltransferase
MVGPARAASYRALRSISTGIQDLPSACAAEDVVLGDPRDRSLMREIVTGTLRWQRRLDHLLTCLAKRESCTLDPEVLTLLRLSAYQLLYLDRVPASAVVDDAVHLTRKARKSSAAGFVNGVLRSLSRQRANLPLPDRATSYASRADQLAYLGVSLSHPDWLVERWLDRMGFDDTQRWLSFNNEVPAPCLRTNPFRGTREETLASLTKVGVQVRQARWAPGALIVESGDPSAQVASGQVFVQDEASQLVAALVQPRAGSRVLDICAAPGGKSTAIAAHMLDGGLVVSCDVRPRRIRMLAEVVRVSGSKSIHSVQIDTKLPLPVAPIFDWVLVDAPCSGLGTLRRDPDVRWRRTASDLPGLAEAQFDLLEKASDAVRPGGQLVYATCSSEPEENEEVVIRFLECHPLFVLVNLSEQRSPGVPPEVIDADGLLRTSPHRHGLGAFFGAVLARR